MGPKKNKKKKASEEEVKEEVKVEEVEMEYDDAPGDDVRYIRPEDQLDLTEEELEQEVQRTLQAKKLHAPTLVKYNFYNQSYKELPPASMDNLFLHFSMDGPMLLKSSKAAQDYMKHEEAKAEALLKMKEEEAAGFEDDQDLLSEVQTTKKNQFDYSDRAAQTFNKTLRDQGFFTEPPPTVTFTGGFTQWKLYDMYMDNYEKKKEMEAREKATKSKKKNANASASIITKKEAPVEKEEEDLIHSKRMGQALKTLERMVNMNANYDIYDDFKYWEDASDQYREAEGTLLPLWRFTDERTKRRTVTSIVWNPQYKDFFAVGYGSYDFMKQRSGMICCYTLKNTSSPEYVFTAPSGVMCMDFHPQHSSLLAVGLYDGTCMVFDVRRKVDKPIYKSTIKSGKHTDPVWQVTWQEEDIAKNMNFFSISLDGTVMNWIMTKSQDLKSELIMELKLTSGKDEAEDEVALTGLAGGTCFDFNKHSEHLFVVGTEEGKIHKCSKAYSGQYLETYEGHHMAVYSVKWNPFHPRVFLSCSADWTVKLWDHNVASALKSFDLFMAVGDISWAPYSSTVFSAVANDGKVHVYDMHQNKHEPICDQKVVKRAKLTRLVFNPESPIILVGDDRGAANALKLSPNLRLLPSTPEEQISRMDAILQACDAAKAPSSD